jgi:hypothetical protein
MLGGKSEGRRISALLLMSCSSVLLAVAIAMAALPAGAAAARTAGKRGAVKPHLVSGTPVALDGPENGSDPLIAYDPVSQTSFIAWSDAQAPDNGVEMCVLPGGATSCSGGGPVLLSVSSIQNPAITGDNTIGLGGLTVLPNGDVVVLGTPVSTGTVAWASPADGSAFLTSGQGLQNGGEFISPVSLFYTFNNAVALGNTDVALLDDYGDYFSDSPFAGPESPNPISSPNSNQGNGGLYPRKSLEVSGPEVGAMAAPSPAPLGTELVVGVADNFAGPNTTLPGCVNSAGTGFGVDVGTISGDSKAAGTLNHSGLPGYGLLACSALSPVLASGGGAGIGVIEEEGNGISGAGSTWTVDWRPFSPTATGGSFGSPVQLQDITAVSLDGAEDFDAVEDSAKGVYASWKDEQGLVLDYSPNGGASWDGPNVIKGVGSEDESQGDPTITAVGNGVGEIAYDNNLGEGDEVYVEQVSFIPPQPTTLTTSQTSGAVIGANLAIPDNTVGETDEATLSGTNAATATGTVKYSLYSDKTCSTSDVVTSSTATVAGGSVPASSPVTEKLKAGRTYYWQAVYSGDQFNAASTSTCGSEKLTVAPVAAPSSAATSGTTVTITISCAGPCTITVTIELPSAGSARATNSKKLIKLTGGKFTLKGKKGGKDHLRLRWSKYASKLLKHDHDKLTTLLQMGVKAGKSRFSTDSPLKLRK